MRYKGSREAYNMDNLKARAGPKRMETNTSKKGKELKEGIYGNLESHNRKL